MSRSVVKVAVVAAALVAAPLPLAAPVPTVSAAGELGAGGEFHALPPERILDTRPESPVTNITPKGKKTMSPSTPTFDVQVLGRAGVPSSTSQVLAVVVSVGVNDASAPGNLRSHPTNGSPSTTALLAFGTGPAVSNLSVVRTGADGRIRIGLNSGATASTHVTIDVYGWISTSSYTTRGSRFITRAPSRILDTRYGTGAPTGPVDGGESLRVQIRGADGVKPTVTDAVPNSANVLGVVLNVAAVNTLPSSTGTFLAALPTKPASPPTTASVNVADGKVKSNTVIVPVGVDGSIHIYNANGSTHVTADVIGYLLAGQNVDTRNGRVVPLASPYRALNTKNVIHGAVKLGPKQSEDWSFVAFANSVTLGGESVGPQAGLIGNMTTFELSRQYSGVPVSGYVTMYPGDKARPTAATVNNSEGSAVSNMAVGQYALNGTMRVYNDQGSVHYIVDVLAVVLKD